MLQKKNSCALVSSKLRGFGSDSSQFSFASKVKWFLYRGDPNKGPAHCHTVLPEKDADAESFLKLLADDKTFRVESALYVEREPWKLPDYSSPRAVSWKDVPFARARSLDDPSIGRLERKALCYVMGHTLWEKLSAVSWRIITCDYVPLIKDVDGLFLNQEGFQVCVFSRGPSYAHLPHSVQLTLDTGTEDAPGPALADIRLILSQTSYNKVYFPFASDVEGWMWLSAIYKIMSNETPDCVSQWFLNDGCLDNLKKSGINPDTSFPF